MTSEKIESKVRTIIDAVADNNLSRDLACGMIVRMIIHGAPVTAERKAYERPQLSTIEWGEIDKAIRSAIEKAFRLDDVRLGSIDLDNQGNVTIWFEEKSPHPLE